MARGPTDFKMLAFHARAAIQDLRKPGTSAFECHPVRSASATTQAVRRHCSPAPTHRRRRLPREFGADRFG